MYILAMMKETIKDTIALSLVDGVKARAIPKIESIGEDIVNAAAYNYFTSNLGVLDPFLGFFSDEFTKTQLKKYIWMSLQGYLISMVMDGNKPIKDVLFKQLMAQIARFIGDKVLPM